MLKLPRAVSFVESMGSSTASVTRPGMSTPPLPRLLCMKPEPLVKRSKKDPLALEVMPTRLRLSTRPYSLPGAISGEQAVVVGVL